MIEVALAIVVGVILIAGATLIYNQAKTSAGSSRAQAKVASLQSLIEEAATQNSGEIPTIEEVRPLWKRKRPDDWFNSPWGGRNAPAEFPAGVETSGVVNGADLSPDVSEMGSNGARLIGATRGGDGAARPSPDNGWTGILLFYRFPTAMPYELWDENRQALVPVSQYATAITNSQGERWFFVATSPGAKSNKDEDLEGDVSDKD